MKLLSTIIKLTLLLNPRLPSNDLANNSYLYTSEYKSHLGSSFVLQRKI
nr:MAG TPA: hypothetical protein [Caudoviricetes sp.]